jgi:nucleotide-binding universal stress UspA family protein
MNRFRNILVAVVNPADSADVVRSAAELARRNDATVTLMGFVAEGSTERRIVLHDGTEVDVASMLAEAMLDELGDLRSTSGSSSMALTVSIGVDFVEVIRQVERAGHDLVLVAGGNGRKRGDVSSSSLVMHLLRKCPVPVWVQTPNSSESPDVVVGVGPFHHGEPHIELNTTLVELASSLAHVQDGVLHIVHAWRLEGESLLRRGRATPPPGRVDELVELAHLEASMNVKRLVEALQPDVPMELHLIKGEPGMVVPQVVRDTGAGILVMGTLARVGIRGVFMGNTAERILGGVGASVLAVKPEGFATPIAR